jgi:hypothetical protein
MRWYNAAMSDKPFQFSMSQMFAVTFLFCAAVGFPSVAQRGGPTEGCLLAIAGFMIFSGGLIGMMCGSTTAGVVFSIALLALFLLGYAFNGP